jgi:hypothetical protein
MHTRNLLEKNAIKNKPIQMLQPYLALHFAALERLEIIFSLIHHCKSDLQKYTGKG